MFDDWKKDGKGDISVHPLMGFATAVFAQSSIGVKLDFPLEGDRIETPSGNLQLVLTPHQAIEIAQALQRAANTILNMKPTGKLS